MLGCVCVSSSCYFKALLMGFSGDLNKTKLLLQWSFAIVIIRKRYSHRGNRGRNKRANHNKLSRHLAVL